MKYTYKNWVNEKILLESSTIVISREKLNKIKKAKLSDFPEEERLKIAQVQKELFISAVDEKHEVIFLELVSKIANTDTENHKAIIRRQINKCKYILFGHLPNNTNNIPIDYKMYDAEFLRDCQRYMAWFIEGTKIENYEWINPPHSKYSDKNKPLKKRFEVYTKALYSFYQWLLTLKLEHSNSFIKSNNKIDIKPATLEKDLTKTEKSQDYDYPKYDTVFKNKSDMHLAVNFIQEKVNENRTVRIADIAFLFYYFQEKNAYVTNNFYKNDFIVLLQTYFESKNKDIAFNSLFDKNLFSKKIKKRFSSKNKNFIENLKQRLNIDLQNN